MWEVIARDNALAYSVIPISSTNRNLMAINGQSKVDISITFLAFIALNLVLGNNSYTQSIHAADYTFVLLDRTKFQSAEVSLVSLIFTRPVVALLVAVSIIIMLAAAIAILLDRKLRHKNFGRTEMMYSEIFGLLIEYVWRILVYEISMKDKKSANVATHHYTDYVCSVPHFSSFAFIVAYKLRSCWPADDHRCCGTAKNSVVVRS